MNFQIQGIREALTFLPAGVVFKAARSTISKVRPAAAAAITSEIRKVWNVPKAQIDKRIESYMSRDLEATVSVGGRSVSLSYFSALQMKGAAVITRSGSRSRKRGKFAFQGVSVTIENSKTTLLHHAFMQTVKNGHVGIFVRTTKDRYPIIHKDSISLASMVAQARISEPVVERIEERMATLFDHELEYYAGEAAR